MRSTVTAARASDLALIERTVSRGKNKRPGPRGREWASGHGDTGAGHRSSLA